MSAPKHKPVAARRVRLSTALPPTESRLPGPFHTDGTLYRALLCIAWQRRALLLLCEQRPLLWICPARQQAMLYAPLSSVRGLCEIDALNLATQRASAPPPDAHAQLPLTDLLWQVPQWSSRGRLLAGVSPYSLLYLDGLPDCAALPQHAGYVRIAALWQHTPSSVYDTMHSLGLSATTVCDFVAVCHAFGVLRGAVPTLPQMRGNWLDHLRGSYQFDGV